MKTTKLAYEDLKFPNYVNNSATATIKGEVGGRPKNIELTFCDVVYSAMLAGLNCLFISDTGRGKTQLISDIAWHHFGGDEEGSGNANWADGRPGFDIQELLEKTSVDLKSGKFDSVKARTVRDDRIKRLFFAVDELNRAPPPIQNEFFDLADGKYTFAGKRLELGREGYSIFMATANVNKLGDDFAGSFELDRALLNRSHLTLDLDHPQFRPTRDDKAVIRRRKETPRVDVAETRDITDLILAANKEIREKAKAKHPYILAFEFLIDDALDYCSREKSHTKSNFPMHCGDCDLEKKDLCSMIKASSERTTSAIKLLTHAFGYVAQLKEKQNVELDPLSAALQAFRFTTYHGNLNQVIAESQYKGQQQEMMEDIIQKLQKYVDLMRDFIPVMLDGHSPKIAVYKEDGDEIIVPATKESLAKLKKDKVAYEERDLKKMLKEEGIGFDWLDAYVSELSRK